MLVLKSLLTDWGRGSQQYTFNLVLTLASQNAEDILPDVKFFFFFYQFEVKADIFKAIDSK